MARISVAVGQPPPDLIEDQADERFGPTDVGWRDYQV